MEIFDSRPLSRIAGAVWTGLAKARLQALTWLAGIVFLALPAAAQQRAVDDVTVKQVASDVYFLFDFNGSNAVFLVTEDSVLLIDTRTHPRDGRDLLERIRKITD